MLAPLRRSTVLFAIFTTSLSPAAAESPACAGGNGSFRAGTSHRIGAFPYEFVFGDWNGDGIPDVATANNSGHSVTVLLGDGDGSFTTVSTLEFARGIESIETGDFNSDGHADLAVGKSGNAIAILLGAGDGSFAAPVEYGAGLRANDLACADLNADGHLDLVAVYSLGHSTHVYLGVGDGTFQAPTTLPSGWQPSYVAIGDLDRDGIPDLAVADFSRSGGGTNASNTLLFMGLGDGSFAAPEPFLEGRNTACVVLEDVNNDGFLDLLLANVGSGEVSVVPGNGDGSFGTPTSYDLSFSVDCIAVADLDNDGWNDIAAFSDWPEKVIVLSNAGDGTFSVDAEYPSDGGYHIAIADLDGDGALDLATCEFFPTAELRTYRGTPRVLEDAYAPNQSCAGAPIIGAGIYPGLLANSAVGDDFFRIEVPANSALNVTLEFAHAAGNLDLYLYDESVPRSVCGDRSSDVARSVSVTDGEQVVWRNTSDAVQMFTLQVRPLGGLRDHCSAYEMHASVVPLAFGITRCPGDGSLIPCPCGNESSDPAEGCANAGGLGARISVSGSDRVANDDAVFYLTQATPNRSAVLVQGNHVMAEPFKDGILCAGGTTYRLQFRPTNAQGAASTTSPLLEVGQVMPGQTRYYQWWYRTQVGSKCNSASNLSSAMQVLWQ